MPSPNKYDLVVVGGGPAGLAAALTAESEHLSAVVLDSGHEIGGQAGTTSLIRNYPGFPDGISGPDLMSRIVDQAVEFTTEFWGPTRVTELHSRKEGVLVATDDGDSYLGTVALLAMGVEPRHIKVRNLAAFVGRGAAYGPPPTSRDYEGGEMFVVGGANSAGQAANHLTKFAGCKVHLLVRGQSVEDKMSGYLVDEVMRQVDDGRIEVHTNTELVGVDGSGHLEQVTIKQGDITTEMPAAEVFVLIGSEPKTRWVPKTMLRDVPGFIKAGSDLPESARAEFIARMARVPYAHETSMPRVFVAGDVRCGTYKRVALAVGDGAAVIPEIHNLRHFDSTNKP